MNLYLIIFIVIIVYFFFFRSRENFQTNQKVALKSLDGSFASVCTDKHLCLTSEPNKKTFSILKFADDLLALESEGYYITACFAEECDNPDGGHIKVDSFNPYAPNAKFKLVANGDSYYLQLYNGQYLGVNENNHFIRVTGRDKAVALQFV
uniref:Fascin domain-containing protein n=1 Tax=viral metagenome TaxID=1070528 RepID=A0A6C0H684_9ZZZZ